MFNTAILADVVKPALVEITVNEKKQIKIELRASIEALLTGINALYKNTQDAPNADEYDEFRQLSAGDLQHAFESFEQALLNAIFIKAGSERLPLYIESVDIPPPGYTKVPRISVIRLAGQLPESAGSLQWYYPAQFGDNAVRVRQVNEETEQWHWSQWQWLRNDQASEAFFFNRSCQQATTF